MTKQEAVQLFKNEYSEQLGKWENDKTAKITAWNNYTDILCKDGLISTKQYDTWKNPFA